MIKMSYKGENYNYGMTGRQEYDIETKIKMTKDCSATDVIEAIAKLMNIATYRVDVKTLRRICDELEEEYGDDRII